MDDLRKAYEKKLEAQLKEWSAQFALLQAKADNARADVGIDYHAVMLVLKQKQQEAVAKLQELRSSGDDAWGDLKAGADKAWSEISSAFHDAAKRFK